MHEVADRDDDDIVPAGEAPEPRHLDVARLIDKLGRRYHDLLGMQLRHLGIDDLGTAQALLLLSVGAEEISVNDILGRGNYLGAPTSHSLKLLVARGYLERSSSSRDRRLARIRRSERGERVCALIRSDDARRFGGRFAPGLVGTFETLRRLDEAWTHALRFGGIVLSVCSSSSFIAADLASLPI